MTELEFINTQPSSYGGAANANLLISSSVVNPGVDNTPQAPYAIIGISIPFQDDQNTKLESALKEVTELRFDFTEGIIRPKVLERQRRNGFFYLRLEKTFVNTLPPVIDTLGVGTAAEQDIFRYDGSEFVFVPFFEIGFNNNDSNPLLNNSTNNQLNSIRQVVDRTSDAANPTNLQAILAGTAQKAQIQDSHYTKVGLINARYRGTKLTSGSVVGNDPALTFREFEGSIHLLDATVDTIKAITDSAREVQSIYFNPLISGSHPTKDIQSFPSGSNFIYEEQDNKFIRIANKKIYITEKDQVLTTSETGTVISVD